MSWKWMLAILLLVLGFWWYIGRVLFYEVVFLISTDREFRSLTDDGSLGDKIETWAGAYVARRPKVRLTIGVYRMGDRRFFAAGAIDQCLKNTAIESVVYEIGSITKAITGILLAKRVEEGLVEFDTTVGEILGDNFPLGDGLKDVRLIQLATHTAGIPRLPSNFEKYCTSEENPYVRYDAVALRECLAELKVHPAATKRSEYSNLGIAILGYLLEQKSGRPYRMQALADVCAPLNLADTFFEPDGDQAARLISGYDPSGKQVSHWTFDAIAPAGALRSTAADMLTLVERCIHPRDETIDAAVARSITSHFDAGNGALVGLCWQIQKDVISGQTICWHNGGTGGFVAFVGFDQQSRIGVVLLANSGDAMRGDDSLDRLAFRILRAAIKTSFRKELSD